MSIIRRDDRPVLERGPALPTLQRLVDRANGSEAITVLVNVFAAGEAVPEHTHQVEEVLLVTVGECTIIANGLSDSARVGDAVIIPPGTRHAIKQNGSEPCQVIAVLGSADAQIGTMS